MVNRDISKEFEKIYDDTYDSTLKFLISRCENLSDINDLIQETYFEFYKILRKDDRQIDNYSPFIRGIAGNKLKKHYTSKARNFTLSLDKEVDEGVEYGQLLADEFDLEGISENQQLCRRIWEYVKSKDMMKAKVFCLKFSFGMSIAEMAEELEISESAVKNYLYRTLGEIRVKFGKEVEEK